MTLDALKLILAQDPHPQVMLPGGAMAMMTHPPAKEGDSCGVTYEGATDWLPLDMVDIAGGILLKID